MGVLASLLFAGSFPSSVSAAPTIKFKGGALDVLTFHGRVALVPPSLGGPVDPVADGFGVELRNLFGVIYEGRLDPGDIVDMGKMRYRFKDKPAALGAGTRDGLYHVINRFRQYSGVWYYTVKIRAYADLTFATEAWMTLLMFEVNGPASVTAEWVEKKNGWRLPRNRF